jgi:fucose permease
VDKRRTLFFIIAFSTFVTLGISGGLLNIAWTFMQDTFDVQLDALGVLLLCSTTGSLIAAFGSGALIGRFGLGRVLFMGTLLEIIGLMGYVLAPTWYVLLLLTFVMYMGRATLDAGMNNFVSAHYGSSAMNWLHAGWGLGLTIAPAVITFILINLGLSWRVGYVVMAGVTGILAVIFALTMPRWNLSKQKQGDAETAKPENASMWETLLQPMVRWSILLFFVYGGIEVGTGQLANTLLVEGRGIAQEVSSLWISFYWGSFTAGRMLVGLIALRLNDRTILKGCFGMALAGAVLLTLPGYAGLIGLALIGLGLSAIFPILIAQTPSLVGQRHAPNTIGFLVGFASFGAAVLPGVFGFLAQRFGLETISHGILVNAVAVLLLYLWLARREVKVQPA